ncbi:MAG: tetratricopeptide repeat protein, partial [Thermoplasmata archaeon]
EAVSINPKYEVAWYNLGVANERIGAFKEAERCYNTAIKLKPNYRSAYLNKGDLLSKTGRDAEAYQCYRNAGVM